jgi:hypothetical protein
VAIDKAAALAQIDAVLQGLPLTEQGITLAAASIRRLAPAGSTYLERMEKALNIALFVGPSAGAVNNSIIVTKLQDILRALRLDYENDRVECPKESDIPAFRQIEKLLTRFHLVAQQLKKRHAGRYTFGITDEYDVQDLLYALLRIEFDDIREEEPTPSSAGKSARMDFLLKKQRIVIEVKKTREKLADKEIGDELLVDIARYKNHPDCSTLVCFVYDPDQRIKNPAGLKQDLEALATDELAVAVYICQH